MGTLDEIKASYGEDFFDRKTSPPGDLHNWAELCVCGHTDRYHSESIGGSFRLHEPETRLTRGEDYVVTWTFYGCRGAMPGRGSSMETPSFDPATKTGQMRVNPTCPCEDHRPVVRVDRPNRYFNQRMPTDRSDPARHPFMVGIRAFMTHLSRRKQTVANPDWYAEEFDRRFVWIEGRRVCSIARCTATDDVWPVFVDTDTETGRPPERSELRCAKHR